MNTMTYLSSGLMVMGEVEPYIQVLYGATSLRVVGGDEWRRSNLDIGWCDATRLTVKFRLTKYFQQVFGIK